MKNIIKKNVESDAIAISINIPVSDNQEQEIKAMERLSKKKFVRFYELYKVFPFLKGIYRRHTLFIVKTWSYNSPRDYYKVNITTPKYTCSFESKPLS